MTIEEHIKKAMEECPLTEQQEDKLLLGLENYLNEIEQVKNLNMPAVIKSVCGDCIFYLTCKHESRDKQICVHYDDQP